MDEGRQEVEQLKAELEQSKTNIKIQDDKDSKKIEALSRYSASNEVIEIKVIKQIQTDIGYLTEED